MMDLLKNKIDEQILFFSRYGSHNYNLNTASSDTDFRVFVKSKKNFETYEFEHDELNICVNDISWFEIMLKKQVPKFLELLFSDYVVINKDIDIRSRLVIQELFSLRDKITTMDLIGMYMSHYYNYVWHKNKLLSCEMGKTKLGYAIHAYRSLDVLSRFCNTGFTDYKYATRYLDSDESRELLLYIKNNKELPSEYGNLLYKKDKLVSSMKEKYRKPIDCCTVKKLTDLFRRL